MKKVLTKLLAVGSIGLLMLSACKKDGTLVTSNGGKAGALTSSATTVILDKTKLNDPTQIINFTFTAPDYGFQAAVTNTLQIDSAGDNWAKPMSVTLSTKTYSQGYSTGDFNALLLKLNLTGGVTGHVNVRIAHSVSASITPVYSNVVNLTVTPFNLAAWVYVPGAYEGWANPGPMLDSLLSATSNGIYTGIINFTAGNNQFLVVPVKGNWTKYATTASPGTGTSLSYPTIFGTTGNNFYAPATPGYYVVTLNTNTNTLTIAPADYYTVIGDAAQGWSTDVPMKFVNDVNQSWAATLPLVSSGSFKIRQDDAWGNSWGIPKSGSAGYGVANTLNNTSNNNIPVPSNGTYTVTFGVPITTFGSPASVTATYSVK
ncbi:MAG TPA: SusE domain-containing protein [Mucilaginibacter sp.]